MAQGPDGLYRAGGTIPDVSRTCCPDSHMLQARLLRGLGLEFGPVLVASSHGTLWTSLEDQPTPLKNALSLSLEQRVHGRASAAQGHGERADIARAGRTAHSSCRRTRVWSISCAGRADHEVRLACSFRRGRRDDPCLSALRREAVVLIEPTLSDELVETPGSMDGRNAARCDLPAETLARCAARLRCSLTSGSRISSTDSRQAWSGLRRCILSAPYRRARRLAQGTAAGHHRGQSQCCRGCGRA